MTRDEPGGDAEDPHRAALQRLARESWGWRNDRQDALHVPLPDWQNWRRVKFWGVPTFAGFRYGDDHHAVAAVWVQWGAEVERGEVKLERGPGGTMAVRSLEATVDSLLAHKRYVGALAAYRLWPGTCAILGFAIPSRGEDELSRAIRDRYVKEGFAHLDRRRPTTPDL